MTKLKFEYKIYSDAYYSNKDKLLSDLSLYLNNGQFLDATKTLNRYFELKEKQRIADLAIEAYIKWQNGNED